MNGIKQQDMHQQIDDLQSEVEKEKARLESGEDPRPKAYQYGMRGEYYIIEYSQLPSYPGVVVLDVVSGPGRVGSRTETDSYGGKHEVAEYGQVPYAVVFVPEDKALHTILNELKRLKEVIDGKVPVLERDLFDARRKLESATRDKFRLEEKLERMKRNLVEAERDIASKRTEVARHMSGQIKAEKAYNALAEVVAQNLVEKAKTGHGS